MIINSETVHEMGSLTDARLLDHSTPRGRNTTTKQTDTVEWSLGVDSHHRDIGHNRVQLVRKMSFTLCLFAAASEGRVMNGVWTCAPSAYTAHASVTTEARSETMSSASLKQRQPRNEGDDEQRQTGEGKGGLAEREGPWRKASEPREKALYMHSGRGTHAPSAARALRTWRDGLDAKRRSSQIALGPRRTRCRQGPRWVPPE